MYILDFRKLIVTLEGFPGKWETFFYISYDAVWGGTASQLFVAKVKGLSIIPSKTPLAGSQNFA